MTISWLRGMTREEYLTVKGAFVAGWNGHHHFSGEMNGQAAWELYVDDCALNEIAGGLDDDQEPQFVDPNARPV